MVVGCARATYPAYCILHHPLPLTFGVTVGEIMLLVQTESFVNYMS